MNVHRQLGPGLGRDAYEECIAIELRELEMDFRRGERLSFQYRGRTVGGAARLDFIVQEKLLLLVRAQEQITSLDKLQFESHLRLGGFRMGLLVNFNVSVLRSGIHRATLKRKDG
jgi:GxxExxY protein